MFPMLKNKAARKLHVSSCPRQEKPTCLLLDWIRQTRILLFSPKLTPPIKLIRKSDCRSQVVLVFIAPGLAASFQGTQS